jgi:asparagine synthase (glutamine-hydrolysing)
MCGIAGFSSAAPVAPSVGHAMLAALGRRGPDSQHEATWDAGLNRQTSGDGPIYHALLHARLAIIDPRPIGDQPMANDSGDIWICYNGEVYDWARHAAELEGRGAHFRTRTDTEFILRAYEAWGMDCLSRLRGMFAFAILDLRQRKLWLVRDRMGLKPLVYAHRDEAFAFGSTVRSVLPFLPAAARNFSNAAIDAYLAHRYVPAPMTIVEGVERLENGHLLCYDLSTGRLEKRAWWQPEPHAADWLATLDEAVAMRTVADRPLGVYLSGGIDSAVIAARLAAQGRQDLHTFTAAFPASDFDESGEAAQTASILGLPNHAIPIPSSIARDFAQIVADLDEPFADPSSFPTWYLSQATTQKVKVVLGGDGGDEVFAGYKRYAKHLRSRWRRGVSLPFLPLASGLARKGFAKWGAEISMSWIEAYSLRFSGFTPGQRSFLQPERPIAQLVYWRLPEHSGGDALHTLMEMDRLNYLPEYILRKADLTTMAHGLELRAPLLDHVWYQALLALPDAVRFTRPAKKMLEAACPQLSELQLFTRKKRGFNPPLTHWLQNDLANRLSGLGERLAVLSAQQLDTQAVDDLVLHYRHHDTGLAEKVLQLVVLEESLRQLAAIPDIYSSQT